MSIKIYEKKTIPTKYSLIWKKKVILKKEKKKELILDKYVFLGALHLETDILVW